MNKLVQLNSEEFPIKEILHWNVISVDNNDQ
jgi:hypothetical protein